MQLSFTATTDPETLQRRLDRLFLPHAPCNSVLERRIQRLGERFQSYTSCYPLPLWAPRLEVSAEMRARTEALLPLKEIRSVFELVLRSACRFSPLFQTTSLHNASSWLDVLEGLHPLLAQADPAAALQRFATDAEARRDFLFALFLPARYGTAFDRYQSQAEWIEKWLRENAARLSRRCRMLDCACGSGEGTYRLAEFVSACGYRESAVDGSTFEPFELFSAAHAYFPHHPQRQEAFRRRIAPLHGGAVEIAFHLEDVTCAAGGAYDLIVCNGLVGGPMLWERERIRLAVASLASRLAPGGVLVAADTFHGGWKKRVPEDALRAVLRENGLTVLEVPEGIGGAKGSR